MASIDLSVRIPRGSPNHHLWNPSTSSGRASAGRSEGNKLSIRKIAANPDHHIWSNNGTWFVHCTVHLPDYTKRRVRASLGTRAKDEARRRRDELFDKLKEPANSGGRN